MPTNRIAALKAQLAAHVAAGDDNALLASWLHLATMSRSVSFGCDEWRAHIHCMDAIETEMMRRGMTAAEFDLMDEELFEGGGVSAEIPESVARLLTRAAEIPLGTELSPDRSDDFYAGFLAGQVNALAYLVDRAGTETPTTVVAQVVHIATGTDPDQMYKVEYPGTAGHYPRWFPKVSRWADPACAVAQWQ